jgi:polyisoprenoid-binding protein YceI
MTMSPLPPPPRHDPDRTSGRRAPRALARLAALALLLGAVAAAAAPRDYRLDPQHSRVLFAVEHLGFAKALGTLSAPRGWLRFDPDDWSSARGEIEIDLATLDLGDAEFNRRLARRDAFDSERHPLARWVVERVEPLDPTRFIAHGRLHWRGGDFPLALNVQFNRLGRHPLTLRRTAGFSATATVSRAALGLTAWKSMVGDAVELRVEVEARRGRRERADEDSTADTPAAPDKEDPDGPAQ